MDATLGITGYTVDTFETTTLIPGLSIVLSGGVATTTFSGTLPNLFNTNVCPGLSDNTAWDGNDAVINTITNWSPGLLRNAYLRVDGTGGTLITSVEFQNLTATDVLIVDHVAVAAATATPEPGTAGLLLPVALAMAIRRLLMAA